MVSMKSQTMASLTDIEALLIECSNCRSQIRVPINAALVLHDLRKVPLTTCSLCLQNFDSTLIEYVKSFVASLSRHQGQEKIFLVLKSE